MASTACENSRATDALEPVRTLIRCEPIPWTKSWHFSHLKVIYGKKRVRDSKMNVSFAVCNHR